MGGKRLQEGFRVGKVRWEEGVWPEGSPSGLETERELEGFRGGGGLLAILKRDGILMSWSVSSHNSQMSCWKQKVYLLLLIIFLFCMMALQ